MQYLENMQQNAPITEEYSINDLNRLISFIKTSNPKITEEEIAAKLGYNEGYISQSRSRGKVSKKFYENVRRAFSNGMGPLPSSYINPLSENSPLQESVLNLTESNKELSHATLIQAQSLKDLVDFILEKFKAIHIEVEQLPKSITDKTNEGNMPLGTNADEAVSKINKKPAQQKGID